MKVLDWLLAGDAVVAALTRRRLLEMPSQHNNNGLIEKYLRRFDAGTHLWGGGVYTPKWISTHYTMMELRSMEIHPETKAYRDALRLLMDKLWHRRSILKQHKYLDMCIAGMLLNLASYGKVAGKDLRGLADYILRFQMPDGGWNCEFEKRPALEKSSVHTTISVLEGLLEYANRGYQYRRYEVQKALEEGCEALLRRRIYMKQSLKEPIDAKMAKAHYPPRWRYDYLRALEFFAHKNHPYDERMEDAISLLKSSMRNGYMLRGEKIPGRTHFALEEGRYGRFNTLRALYVLKMYDSQHYHEIIRE